MVQGKGKKYFYEHVAEAVNEAYDVSLKMALLDDKKEQLKEIKQTVILYLNEHRHIIADIRKLDAPLNTLTQACGDLLDEAHIHVS